MKGLRIVSLFFFIALIIDVVLLSLDKNSLRIYSKGSLMPILIFIWWLKGAYRYVPIGWWHLSALLLSWLGDLLLQFGFFLPGLFSFLLAHVFYILFLNKMTTSRFNMQNFWWIFIPGTAIGYWLTISDPKMTIPVVLYATIILIMARVAIFTGNKFIQSGATLFILSDLILAWQLFKFPVTAGNELVMITYGAAQWLLLFGTGQQFYYKNT
jgi:uncharacterized membrane protein YhhN